MCGIVGIVSNEEVSKQMFLALYSLQHRGQESAGMTVVNQDGNIDFHKGMGLVNQVFTERIIEGLKGTIGIGHVRYSTTGQSNIQNAQPFIVDMGEDGFVAIGHNGNLVNIKQLRDELEVDGYTFETSSDTELVAVLLKKFFKGDLEAAVVEIAQIAKGAFSIVFMTADKIVAITDPNGFKPLCIGKQGDNYAISSESCALDTIGFELLRDVNKGEVVTIDRFGMKSFFYDQTQRDALCVFEFVYFARPDSIIHNRSVYEVRVKMGEILAKEHQIEADVVIGVPDSGNAAAIGYSRASGISYCTGLIKNRYVGRTFINPDENIRKLGVRIKLNPIKKVLQGQRVVVVDDSIVRGTTSRQIVKLLRDSGAKEVHMMISSPSIKTPCFYGIDTASKGELIAADHSVAEICETLGADSLGYLSVRGMVDAVDAPNKEFCLGCFNQDYPVAVPEQKSRLKLIFDQ